ncbi:hypothetical protein HMPREF9141_1160 [Prevotella multiformis DSM 16608]|uniref:Uncharacterized protein n=1 Tax=Prevotella multiformis DSM 16608 TaxID=888743 RepID=F0F6D8_9BACT|nr:hypothetical protein HMPREF9141_1160 [Prevotella multiformis DSM 16608]
MDGEGRAQGWRIDLQRAWMWISSPIFADFRRGCVKILITYRLTAFNLYGEPLKNGEKTISLLGIEF